MQTSRTVFIIVGILFHLFYLWSIFDIYFVSPLVHGMKHYQSTEKPPAKRLFFIVADGLRADTAFAKINFNGTEQHLAPFLRSIILKEGTYGVSHTRMPTESRPGHVAMIAGFYEDVSAVTKGWKENPVDFDSVFNQSSHTYSFGSPDILPMFAQGASDPNRIDTWMYGHEFEDFTKSSIELDAFTFDHLYDLFDNSTKNATLGKQIKEEKVIFFLHLLGCDTAGHSYRPYSKEYYSNVQYIDKQLEILVPKVHEFFGDEETAFIFTADHGMSALGSHGDGHPNNTRTPLVAFGKGINKPIIDHNLPPYEEADYGTEFVTSEDWNLDFVKRHDVQQADIASLMSYLIGANFAANSVGRLPLSYIHAKPLDKLQSYYKNALAFVEQYLVKEREISSTEYNFKPFPAFQKKSIESYMKDIDSILAILEDVSSSRLHETFAAKGFEKIENLMNLSMEGLFYLQTYNWLLLKSVITLGFIGWISYSFMIFLNLFVLHDNAISSKSWVSFVIFLIIGIALNVLFFIQKSPINYYFYGFFPIYFWEQLFKNRENLRKGATVFFNGIPFYMIGIILALIVVIFQSIAWGFFNRKLFSFLFVLFGFYPFAVGGTSFLNCIYWLANCLFMTMFTWSDAIKTESLIEINVAGAVLIILSLVGYFKFYGHLNDSLTKILLATQIFLIGVSIYSTNTSIISLQARTGLPLHSQIVGWIVLVVSLVVMPLLHYFFGSTSKNLKLRFFIIAVTFAPYFLILTISFESLFYVGYSLLLSQWIEIETNYKRKMKTSEDWMQILRISIIGFFLAQIAFFGTGNIASISSFSLESVYRLIPVFDPFSMGALLIIKLVIPYVLLSAGLGILNVSLHMKTFTVSTLIISVSNLLSLNFFYNVQIEGSWLDIGISISNYCIAILSSLFMIILEFFSHVVLKGVEVEAFDEKEVEKKQI